MLDEKKNLFVFRLTETIYANAGFLLGKTVPKSFKRFNDPLEIRINTIWLLSPIDT